MLRLAIFTSAQLHLREKRLAFCAAFPVRVVVVSAVPDEIVIRLTELGIRPAGCRVARPVAGVLEQTRDGFHRQLVTVKKCRRPLALAIVGLASVVVRAESRLIHPCHHRRPAGRAHRAGNKRFFKPQPLPGQAVEVRRSNCLLTITPNVRRGILDDDPKYVRPRLICSSHGDQCKKGGGEDCFHWSHFFFSW